MSNLDVMQMTTKRLLFELQRNSLFITLVLRSLFPLNHIPYSTLHADWEKKTRARLPLLSTIR